MVNINEKTGHCSLSFSLKSLDSTCWCYGFASPLILCSNVSCSFQYSQTQVLLTRVFMQLGSFGKANGLCSELIIKVETWVSLELGFYLRLERSFSKLDCKY